MRKTALIAAVCLAGLVAGCGSSTTKTVVKTPPPSNPPGNTTPTGTSGATGSTGSTGTSGVSGPTQTGPTGNGTMVGSTGTMGPPSNGGQYSLTNQTVLQHLTNQLGHNLSSHGYTSLQGSCRAFSQTQAECEFTGVNPKGEHFDDIFTLTVNLSTGAFTVSNIHAGHSMVGSTGTMGPPPGGGQFDLTNHTVLQHLTNQIGRNLASHGYRDLRGACKAFSHTQAACAFKGINPQGQRFADVFTLTVNLRTGAFRISNVRPFH
jgi:hypothetical protein